MCNNCHMELAFNWNPEKNQQLINQRGVSFSDVVESINRDGLVDTYVHPNQRRYPDQSVYVVDIHGYLYLVPYVEQDERTRFLKTIIPNQRAMRRYGRRS